MTDQPENPENSREILPTGQGSRALVASIAPRGDRAPVLRKTPFESLSTQVIPRALTFDSHGRLWGAGFGGAIRWEIIHNQVTYQTFHAEHGLAGHDVLAAYATDSHVWFGHHSGHISTVNINSLGWTIAKYRAPAPIRALFEHNGDVCAVTSRGLFNIDTNEMHHTPFYPLTAITAFGQIWVGAADGLWTFENNQWSQKQKCGAVPFVASASGRVYFAGSDGLSIVTRNGQVKFQYQSVPVTAMATTHDDDSIYTITADNKLMVITKRAGEIVTWYDQQTATHLAASRDVVVFGVQDMLFCKLTNANQPMRLTPDLRENLPQIQSIFVDGEHRYAQAVNGTLWRQSTAGWREVPSKVPMGEVKGITTHPNTGVLIGMTGRFPLIAMGGDAMLDSQQSPFTHIQAFNNNGQTIAAKPDDRRVRTLYHYNLLPTDNGAQWHVIRPATTDDLTKISGGTDEFNLLYDGNHLTVHANTSHATVLPVDIPGKITALGSINETVLIGTSKGLWQVTIGDGDKTQFGISHGLPGQSITKIVSVSKHEALIVTSGGVTQMRTER